MMLYKHFASKYELTKTKLLRGASFVSLSPLGRRDAFPLAERHMKGTNIIVAEQVSYLFDIDGRI